MDNTNETVTPAPGMGATLLMWSDRRPYTIERVTPAGCTLYARQDKATRIDKNGMSESQEYTYEADPTAALERFDLQGDGTWKGKAGRLAIGHRRAYHDFSF